MRRHSGIMDSLPSRPGRRKCGCEIVIGKLGFMIIVSSFLAGKKKNIANGFFVTFIVTKNFLQTFRAIKWNYFFGSI